MSRSSQSLWSTRKAAPGGGPSGDGGFDPLFPRLRPNTARVVWAARPPRHVATAVVFDVRPEWGSPVIEDILPPTVASVDTITDRTGGFLFPAEAAVIARAVDKRRREFTTVRACARQALATLGLEPQPILPGERGAPTWPPGVVGSMTHCDSYRAAAVAWAEQITYLGIDAEPHDQLPTGVLGVIATFGERAQLTELARLAPAVYWDRVLFSVKESIYKAWFPLMRKWLGIEEIHGRWGVCNGLVLTAVTLGRRPTTVIQP